MFTKDIFKNSRILLISGSGSCRKFQASKASIDRTFMFLFDAGVDFNSTRVILPADNNRRRLSLGEGLQPSVWQNGVSQHSPLRLIAHTDNGWWRTFKRPLSQMLFQVRHGDDAYATALTSSGSWLWRQILSLVANIDFRLSRFLEHARRSRDAGVDADAAWRNHSCRSLAGPSSGSFASCHVSSACETREGSLAKMWAAHLLDYHCV